MAENDICMKMQEEINALSGEPEGDILAHISECVQCREQYEKLCEMKRLLKQSAPAVPELRSAVIEKIMSENISVAPVYKRRRIPFGTIAAAATILAVFAAAYGVKTPDGIFSRSKNDAADNGAPMEAQLFSATTSDGAATGSAEAKKTAYYNAIYDYKYDIEEETVEAEAEAAPDEKPKVMFSVSPETGVAENDIDIDGFTGTVSNNGEKLDGTQSVTADDINGEVFVPQTETVELEMAKNTAREEILTKDNESDGTTAGPVSGGGATSGGGGSSGGGSSGGGSSGGGSLSSAQNDAAGRSAEEIAKDIYEVMLIVYPDRISPEVFENTKAEVYLAFMESIEDPDSGYTEQALLAFAAEYGA